MVDYANKEVNNYFTGLHNKQIKENLISSKTIGEAIGHIGEIAGSTISNALYNLTKGIGKAFENVDDALHSAYLTFRDTSGYTNEKLIDAGKTPEKSKIQETIHNVLFSPTKFTDPKLEKLGVKDWNDWSIEENIDDLIKDKTTDWFNTTFKLDQKDQTGVTKLEKFEQNSLITESNLGGQIMQNFGQMIPSIVLGNIYGSAASLGSLYAKAYGSSAEYAHVNGASIIDASSYAALSAGVEVFTEKISGITGGIVPKGQGWLDDIIKYSNKTGELLGGAVGEVFEEHLSNIAQPFVKKITTNKDSNISDMFKEDVLDAFKDTTLTTLGTTALCNLLGFGIGVVNANIDNNNMSQYYKSLPQQAQTIINGVINYDNTSTTSQPVKTQSNQSNQQNYKIKSETETRIDNSTNYESIKQQELLDIKLEIQNESANLSISDPKFLEKSDLILEKFRLQTEIVKNAHSKNMTFKEYVKKCGEISQLDAKTQAIIDQRADFISKIANKAEPQISQMMKSLEVNGAKLVGFEARFKSKESIARKIAKNLYGLTSVEAIDYSASNINDSLRYTLILNKDNYTDQLYDSLHELLEKGYQVDFINNAWGDGNYQGVNATLISPNGMPFE